RDEALVAPGLLRGPVDGRGLDLEPGQLIVVVEVLDLLEARVVDNQVGCPGHGDGAAVRDLLVDRRGGRLKVGDGLGAARVVDLNLVLGAANVDRGVRRTGRSLRLASHTQLHAGATDKLLNRHALPPKGSTLWVGRGLRV